MGSYLTAGDEVSRDLGEDDQQILFSAPLSPPSHRCLMPKIPELLLGSVESACPWQALSRHLAFSFLHLATSGSLPPNCFTSSKICYLCWPLSVLLALSVCVHVCTGVYVCRERDSYKCIVQLALAASSRDTSFFPTG